MAQVVDNDPAHFDASGLLALQLHSGKPMLVQFKDIWLKEEVKLKEGVKR